MQIFSRLKKNNRLETTLLPYRQGNLSMSKLCIYVYAYVWYIFRELKFQNSVKFWYYWNLYYKIFGKEIFYSEKLVFKVMFRGFFTSEASWKRCNMTFKSPISSVEWYFLHEFAEKSILVDFFRNEYRKYIF